MTNWPLIIGVQAPNMHIANEGHKAEQLYEAMLSARPSTARLP